MALISSLARTRYVPVSPLYYFQQSEPERAISGEFLQALLHHTKGGGVPLIAILELECFEIDRAIPAITGPMEYRVR